MMSDSKVPYFFSKLQAFRKVIGNVASLSDYESEEKVSSVNLICEKLAELLLKPEYTFKVALYFRRELLIILFNAVDFSLESQRKHTQVCVALAKIINIHPDVENFSMNYFRKYPAPFDSCCKTEATPPRKKAKLTVDWSNDLEIVVSTYLFLKKLPDFFKTTWTWSSFIRQFFNHENDEIRWYCYQCIQIITGMNEYLLKKLIDGNLNEDTIHKCILSNESDGPELVDIAYSEDNVPLPSKNVICISNIYLPTYSNITIPEDFLLIETESTKKNLRRLALGIASSRAMIIQGPIGSGKTFLVEHLAAKTGRVLGDSFIKVQLSDQTDSKMLLGAYCCTDVPGEFVWQPGVLTQAVLDGSWLLLEDIDSANMDIASLLLALLQNSSLTVPGYRDAIPISASFKLFMTHRLLWTMTGYHKKQSTALTLLEKNVLQINIDPLTPLELEEIIQAVFPKMRTIASRIIEAFLVFVNHSNNRSNRLVSTRDLFKWCTRAVIDYDVASQNSALNVLQNAIDVLCCPYPNIEERVALARDISAHLGIINEKADFYCTLYKPTLIVTNDSIKSGRLSLQKQVNLPNIRLQFCFTRPSTCLLERIMCCVSLKEPVLLVGETGTGKTSAIQYLAYVLGVKLIVINMNQQSDSADLLGGYKPVDLKFVASPIRREFENVFRNYFDVTENKQFLKNIDHCFNKEKWAVLLKLMMKSCRAALKRLKHNEAFPVATAKKGEMSSKTKLVPQNEKKRQEYFLEQWYALNRKLIKLEIQLKHKTALAFSFIEGSLVKAIKEGYWVLLDEINLANAETLECLSGLLEGSRGSISLLEKGDKKPVVRHPNFTLFACMNPSTDIGKHDLPTGLRNRFTEFYVDELTDQNDLLLLVDSYLKALSIPTQKLENIVKFYLLIRKKASTDLNDGLGHKPHYSLRTLCRALMIAARNPCKHFVKSLYEAFCLSFLTQLDTKSYKTVEMLITKFILGSAKDMKSVLNQPIPKFEEDCIQFEGYWVVCGTLEPKIVNNYILTDSVHHNLRDLVRIISIGKFPVLLQGDTSVGKTSLITYLAHSSGNNCVRINNHEHTDLQEYVGSYVADASGKLVFKEGILVQAMRKGHWLILDELNLAPTDVLEALNRVLDDNRELFIPETQEVVKAHSNFMLFATQNPPGLYGGRKMLSRAFRNRFVELHFNEIPPDELEFILHKRCEIPLSYSKKMVAVMTDLQLRRRGSATFAGKQGFITLRDLFRWGERYHLAKSIENLYDWDQHLVDEGYLLLAGRVRKPNERNEIAQVLEKQMKRKVVPNNLFTLHDKTSTVTKHILQTINEQRDFFKHIVWTYNMRQLAVLVAKAFEFKEPVLLVGETGGGKTSVCQILANISAQQLYTVNCHMHTESSDFIGGLRPVRDHSESNLNKLFEWVDGPLIKAVITGGMFLADEISLADDSVLERLNSLLEPERTLLLAEKGADINIESSAVIIAHKNFQFVGTMNPGGDYGKKELSPALRNRFTEIWCDSCTNREDLIEIIEHNIKSGTTVGNQSDLSGLGKSMMDFVEWFKDTEIGKRFTMSIRDILTWVNFINICTENVGVADSFLHGACLTFLDSLGSGNTNMENCKVLDSFQERCFKFLEDQLQSFNLKSSVFPQILNIEITNKLFGISPFFIELGLSKIPKDNFVFSAPTCAFNTLRLLRGLQLSKAILLEGSPGVGKTSLVTAVAKSSGHELLRINLSDQTDISDLFGADFPVEGGMGGSFAWRNGPFLQALKKGDWILLDELNLASQSVLEGLNACLDHRGEVFIPELGKVFRVKPGTRLFACQNPLKQGGCRRGLPQSFLNRFTQVFIKPLTEADFNFIVTSQFPSLKPDTISKMIKFNFLIVEELDKHNFGHKGSPWEFNLRDVLRWCTAITQCDSFPETFATLIYSDRMRSVNDREQIFEIFYSVFGIPLTQAAPIVYVTEKKVHIGDVCLEREICGVNMNVIKQSRACLVLRNQLHILRSLAYCINFNWMAILVGASGSGKSSVIQTLARLLGKSLQTLPVTSAMDTTDILGGFEQVDYTRHLEEISLTAERLILDVIQNRLIDGNLNEGTCILKTWEKFSTLLRSEDHSQTLTEETKLFVKKLKFLLEIISSLKSNTDGAAVQKFDQLETKCSNLLMQVLEEQSLNAGGKFEWVDSMLIKCLREGSWLVIDNVNLCSPAVLDRLNGLLEPNGVLTIGERGVKENGEMVEIKPHKDFRLFLTMDPKNGEISRAMRNRGVEIYVPSENEEGYIKNDLDLRSLINLNGLSNPLHIEVVIKLHNFTSDLILGDKPTINHLLQVAFLTSQQLLRGFDIITSLTYSISDVYYKTRKPSDFVSSDALTLIEEQITTALTANSNFFHKHTTLETFNLTSNSCLEKIKQQAVVLRNNSNRAIVPKCLINAYTISSQRNLKIRYIYLRHMLTQMENEHLTLNDKYFQTMYKFTKIESDYPFDRYWLTNLNVNNKTANQLYAILYFHSRSFLVNNKVDKSVTLLNVLNGVRSKKIEARVDDILEKETINLLDLYDHFYCQIMQDENFQIDDVAVIEIISLLQWKFVFYQFLQTSVYNMDVQTYTKLIDKLHVHYKWFIKYSVKQLCRLLNAKLPETLLSTINEIRRQSTRDFSVLKKIATVFQKHILKPPPFIDENQMVLYEEYKNIIDTFDFNFHNQLTKVISFSLKNRNLRKLVIATRIDLNDSLSNLENFVKLKSLHDKFITDFETDNDKMDALVFPVLDQFARLSVHNLMCNLNTFNENEILEKAITVPTNLIATLECYYATKSECLKHEIKAHALYYLLNAGSITGLGSLCEKFKNKTMSQIAPILSSAVAFLLIPDVNKTEILKAITFGHYKRIIRQRKLLKLNLWRNLLQISDSSYDYINCQSRYIHNSYEEFIKQFSKPFHSFSSSTTNHFNVCVEGIMQMYEQNILYDKHEDCKMLLTLFKQCKEAMDALSDVKEDCLNVRLSLISSVHFLVSYLKTLLTSKLPLIDPLVKTQLKKQYCEDEIKEFSSIISAYQLQNEIYSYSKETVHKHVSVIIDKIKMLEEKNVKLTKYAVIRPRGLNYSAIIKEISHFVDLVLTPKIATKLYTDLNDSFIFLQQAVDEDLVVNTSNCEKCITAAQQHCYNYNNLIKLLNRYRYNYSDIIAPLLSSITEFLYAVTLKVNLNQKVLTDYNNKRMGIDLNKDLLNIVRFPVLTYTQTTYLDAIKLYTEPRIQNFISITLESEIEDLHKTENFRLLKCGIHELYNIAMYIVKYYNILDKKIFFLFDDFLKVFVSTWKKQEQEIECKKKEGESLYKFESKSEEVELQEEFKELFPSFRDRDFSDLESKMLDDAPELPVTHTPSYTGSIKSDDIRFISEMHSEFLCLCTETEWLQKKSTDKNVDFITPLVTKFKLFQLMVSRYGECLNYKIDTQIISSLSVLVNVAENFGKHDVSSIKKINYDFYKDSNIEEVKEAYDVLKELQLYIEELLKEWPDHPSLKLINVVIERIFNFDMASPLSRYLTGLEILLTKCHEWEENAHSGVSLQQYIQNLVRQIIAWRKLEMRVWKDSLNNAFERMNKPVAKWWFYIYGVMTQFIEEDCFTTNNLVETFKKFIEQSNLGEFSNRLHLLLTFHCHAIHLQRTKKTDTLISVLWNLHQYFKQYETNIVNKIRDLRAPIEKMLKEYVKIVRWKDISYWAIKQTVERTHKTLHKRIKEFENVLKQPVTSCLTLLNTSGFKEVGIWDKAEQSRCCIKNPLIYMVEKVHWEFHDSLEEPHESFTNLQKYFTKSRRFCKNIIIARNYSNLIESINELVTNIIESGTYLQNLEINTSLLKEKQRSQAKGILQQKRKGLSDLFKQLTEIGLSYRTGIIQFRTNNSMDFFLTKSLDLKAALSHLNNVEIDKELLFNWKDCEIYYYKAQARYNTLKISMQSPAQELGLSNLDRCKGFSENLMQMIYKHKSALINSSRVLYYLRFYARSFSSFCETSSLPRFPLIIHNKLVSLLKNIVMTSEQYKVILTTAPEQDNIEIKEELFVLKHVDHNFIQYKHDKPWQLCIKEIDCILFTSQKLLANLRKITPYLPSVEFKCVEPEYIYIPVDDVLESINSISTSLQTVSMVFHNIPIMDSAQWLINEIHKVKTDINKCNEVLGNPLYLKGFENNAKKLLKKSLIVIQNMYKNCQETADNGTCEKRNLLKISILANLYKDIETLDYISVLKIAHNVAKSMHRLKSSEISQCKSIILQIIPIFNQLVCLYQYFLTQQVSSYRSMCKMSSILSQIFNELATKGFCAPPEFSEELTSEGDNQISGGMGLGEGEGEQDVSDRIESEDQLEDATPGNEEKETQDDKECKEEENGIEMSDDFDAKLQDIEKGDDGNENEKSEDEEIEEQMGETEKDADQLDQQIWGSDEEEIESDNEDEKEEKGDRGEKQGQDELGAKECDTSNETDNKKQTNTEEKKKEINELEEQEFDDDQIDPYHGNPPQYPEPEVMDLPDNLEVDDDMQEKDENPNEINPFDIDTVKDQQLASSKPESESSINENDTEEDNKSEISNASNKECDREQEEEQINEDADFENDNNIKIAEEKLEDELKDDKENQCSALDETQTQEQSEAMEVDNIETADNVKANKTENQKNNQTNEEICQEDKPDREGVGQSRMEESKTGHQGQAMAQDVSNNQRDKNDIEKNRKPGESDSKRSLGDVSEPIKKKLKTTEVQEDENIDDEKYNGEEGNAEIYQHIKDAKQHDDQVLDTATKEQAEEQKELSNFANEENTKESPDTLEDEDEINVNEKTAKKKTEKIKSNEKKMNKTQPDGVMLEDKNYIEVDGEIVSTATVGRGSETTHHTQYNLDIPINVNLSLLDMNQLRLDIEYQLSSWTECPTNLEAEKMWTKISSVTSSLAQSLSEQLRLVLEPTQASRLKGDYRTGRRINMRKVIPYIASQFRKDKIWLRRTKPSKREYQIVLAIDDSSSMADNHSKELAFESVALISKALTLLESGQLSVISFGETTEVLHKLTDVFTERSGSKILQKFQFLQQKTCVAKLVDFATEMLNSIQASSTSLIAKLLIIVSDGRGIFSEGENYVQQAVRRAKLLNIFMVFIVIDNPESKDSILDIRMPIFKDGKLLGIKPYMDSFPFPFYIILKNINSLPDVLSDALRQWFEIVSNDKH
ncbi:hypothetical protein FQA39_LY15748 [Lamprigera yunnana]|nr:hypothetical protein FQA39_LY15748 [Lamprigera yunnana]